MSVTTTSGAASRPGLGNALTLFRRRERDETPPELYEFFSPTAAIAATEPFPLAKRSVALFSSMVFIIIILTGIIPIDRIVAGNGRIISLEPEDVKAPFAAGVVKTIAVSEGDIVRKGQLLAQMDPTYATADNSAAQDQVDRYQTEVDRLTAEIHQVPYKPAVLTKGALVQEGIYAQRAAARTAQLRYYQGQIDAQRALMAQADAQVRQYAKETGVAVDVEKMREILEHQAVGSRLDTLNAVTARLETERQVLFNIQQYENAKQSVAALTGQLEAYNQQWFADASQNLTDDSVQLATYRDQLEHAAFNSKLIDVRADQDAIVLSIAPVSVGTVMQAGQTFFTLVPVNAPLEVSAQITADMTGFLVVGQPAEIKFLTFPFPKFGMAHGTLRLVSADSFLTGNTASVASATSSGTASDAVYTGTAPTSPLYYNVRITLDRLKMNHLPADFHVTPGMMVEADIKVGRHTVLDYLVERILPFLEEGMHEPV